MPTTTPTGFTYLRQQVKATGQAPYVGQVLPGGDGYQWQVVHYDPQGGAFKRGLATIERLRQNGSLTGVRTCGIVRPPMEHPHEAQIEAEHQQRMHHDLAYAADAAKAAQADEPSMGFLPGPLPRRLQAPRGYRR